MLYNEVEAVINVLHYLIAITYIMYMIELQLTSGVYLKYTMKYDGRIPLISVTTLLLYIFTVKPWSGQSAKYEVMGTLFDV